MTGNQIFLHLVRCRTDGAAGPSICPPYCIWRIGGWAEIHGPLKLKSCGWMVSHKLKEGLGKERPPAVMSWAHATVSELRESDRRNFFFSCRRYIIFLNSLSVRLTVLMTGTPCPTRQVYLLFSSWTGNSLFYAWTKCNGTQNGPWIRFGTSVHVLYDREVSIGRGDEHNSGGDAPG